MNEKNSPIIQFIKIMINESKEKKIIENNTIFFDIKTLVKNHELHYVCNAKNIQDSMCKLLNNSVHFNEQVNLEIEKIIIEITKINHP